MSTLNCISFVAVSTKPQTERESPDAQHAANLETIQQLGGSLHSKLYADGESRNIISFEQACINIPAYAQLRDILQANKKLPKAKRVHLLVYMDATRLGRKAALVAQVVAHCLDAGIALYDRSMPPNSLDAAEQKQNEAMLFMSSFAGVMSESEIKKLARRHDYGMRGRVKKGLFPGLIPYGWRLRFEPDGSEVIEIDPEPARIIRQVLIDWYLVGGLGRPAICEMLNEAGVPTPAEWRLITRQYRNGRDKRYPNHFSRSGEPTNWKSGQLRYMFLLVERYAGIVEYNRRSPGGRAHIVADGAWPPILTRDEAKRVQAEIERRANARRAVHRPFRFSLCVWCQQCGKRMRMEVKRGKDRRITRVYARCHSGHVVPRLDELKIIAAVRDAILYVQDEANRQHILAGDTTNTETLQARATMAENAIKEAEDGIGRAHRALVRGSMTEQAHDDIIRTLKTEIVNHRAEIVRLYDELDEAENKTMFKQRLEEVASKGLAMLDHPDLRVANAWMREHIHVTYDSAENILYVDYI